MSLAAAAALPVTTADLLIIHDRSLKPVWLTSHHAKGQATLAARTYSYTERWRPTWRRETRRPHVLPNTSKLQPRSAIRKRPLQRLSVMILGS